MGLIPSHATFIGAVICKPYVNKTTKATVIFSDSDILEKVEINEDSANNCSGYPHQI